jgi:hypothetical protein
MNSKIPYRFLLVSMLIWSGMQLFSQDKIVKVDGDTIDCRILSINDEKVEIEIKLDNRKVKSFIPVEKVEYFSFGIMEQLRKENDTSSVYLIELQDGSELYANIIGFGKDELLLKSQNMGKLSIKIFKIKKIENIQLTKSKQGDYWFPNPNATRYFFAPTAINLEKGTGYYQNAYVIINMVNYGVTDWFSVGGGFEFLSTVSSLSGGGTPIVFITPKVGFPVGKKLHLGAGFLGGFFVEETAGILYGVGTYGTTDNNVTLGLGWGFVSQNFQENPFITVSGMLRVGRKFGLVTENWLIPADGYYGLLSYGCRIFGPKMSVDIGLLNNGDIADILIIGLPYVDFVIKF